MQNVSSLFMYHTLSCLFKLMFAEFTQGFYLVSSVLNESCHSDNTDNVFDVVLPTTSKH